MENRFRAGGRKHLLAVAAAAVLVATVVLPTFAAGTLQTVTAFVQDQQCQGGDIVVVTLSATDDFGANRWRWDFNNDGRWDTPILTSPTVMRNYPDEVTRTARVGAFNAETGTGARDTVTFATLRCP